MLGPKFRPSLARGAHFGKELPPASSFRSAKTGQPKVCRVRMRVPTLIPEKRSNLDVPSSIDGSVLCKAIAFRSAYGQRARCTAAGQRELA